jgi:hypothetical protein
MSTKVQANQSFKTKEYFDTFDVFCGWGEGPDVGINVRRKKPHNELSVDPYFVSFDFRAEEAEALAAALLKYAAEARRMDKELDEYFEAHKNDPESTQQDFPF